MKHMLIVVLWLGFEQQLRGFAVTKPACLPVKWHSMRLTLHRMKPGCLSGRLQGSANAQQVLKNKPTFHVFAAAQLVLVAT